MAHMKMVTGRDATAGQRKVARYSGLPVLWQVVTICLVALAIASASGATVSWIGESGDWNSATNSSNGTLPGPGDDLVIDRPTTVTGTHLSGTHGVKSILCQEAFSLLGGSLTASNTIQINNGFTLSATLIKGTILEATNGKVIIVAGSGATLDGVTLASDISIGNQKRFFISGGLTFVGGAKIMMNTSGLGAFLVSRFPG